ncbi:MAG: hypothetical protein WBB33_00515 [Candidatus Saccharimonadales bacterium]
MDSAVVTGTVEHAVDDLRTGGLEGRRTLAGVDELDALPGQDEVELRRLPVLAVRECVVGPMLLRVPGNGVATGGRHDDRAAVVAGWAGLVVALVSVVANAVTIGVLGLVLVVGECVLRIGDAVTIGVGGGRLRALHVDGLGRLEVELTVDVALVVQRDILPTGEAKDRDGTAADLDRVKIGRSRRAGTVDGTRPDECRLGER